MTGVICDEANTVTGLSQSVTRLSIANQVVMLTFYNDLNLVYATSPADGENTRQKAWRQVAPGLAKEQRLPGDAVVSMTSGQIRLYRRLAVLDTLGNVRSVSGSLDGSWSIADSQVTALGSAKNTVGVGWELDAVASVVIGGTIITGGFGYVLGSVLGALVRSILDPLTSDFGVPAEWTTIVIGLMILIFVVLQRAVMAVGGDKK